MFRVTVLLTLCVTQAWGQFPSLRQQFQNLPCLAPLIEKIDEESPKTVEEALSLPPYQGPKRMAPREYGEVNFPISSTLAERQELQAWFNQGLGLIHLGAPLEAERCFRKVIALDPKCPMAYWGLMLANESASRRAELYLERAAHLQSGGVRLSRLETACLRAYLDKWDPMGRPYSTLNPEARTQRLSKLDQALEDLTMTFPENREVLALLFRSHTQRLLALGKAPEFAHGLRLLDEKIQAEGDTLGHPSRIYLVELWKRHFARQAGSPAFQMMDSEVRYPTMLVPVSEAFGVSGNPGPSLAATELGLRLLHKQAAARGETAAQQEGFVALAERYLLLLGYVGRIDEGLAFLRQLESVPRVPVASRMPNLKVFEEAFTEESLAERTFKLLIRGERWEALAGKGRAWQHPKRTPFLQMLGNSATRVAAHALGEETGELPRAEDLFREMLDRRVPMDEPRVRELAVNGRSVETLLSGQAPKSLDFVAKGLYPEEYLLRLAAPLTPRESIKRFADELLSLGIQAPLVTAQTISVLHEIGADEAAAAAFTSAFRKQAVLGDQNHPAWVRVNPVAEKVGLSGRWTLPGQVLAFPGMTPAALEQQGLRWWKEAPAKALILTNAEGEDVALAEMRGRPVVVQYFVGVHCGFCLSALGALADKMPAFDEAGVAVLAVSPDKSADLKAFVQSSEPGKWPFPLLADPSGRAMKACGIWDDFADEPMHGTVLMDADGKILWSFSGHEPFKAWDLLLSELRRPGVLKADRR